MVKMKIAVGPDLWMPRRQWIKTSHTPLTPLQGFISIYLLYQGWGGSAALTAGPPNPPEIDCADSVDRTPLHTTLAPPSDLFAHRHDFEYVREAHLDTIN